MSTTLRSVTSIPLTAYAYVNLALTFKARAKRQARAEVVTSIQISGDWREVGKVETEVRFG